MDFEKLPADWPTIPLTDDDHIADVLDLFVGVRDRMVGSLLILICDEQHRPLQPVMINDIFAEKPWRDPRPIAQLAEEVADTRPEASVLCAIARRGRTRATKTDRQLAQMLQRAFADRLELLGVHLITLDGTAPIALKADEAA